jgi:hypothetical protein
MIRLGLYPVDIGIRARSVQIYLESPAILCISPDNSGQTFSARSIFFNGKMAPAHVLRTSLALMNCSRGSVRTESLDSRVMAR